MRVAMIDGSRVTSEAAFWREYLAAVHPDGSVYFGLNLAAFRDAVVAGGPGWPGELCQLRVVGHAAAGVGLEFFARLAEIASEALGFELVLA
ncbi:MAG: hypothetical protein ACRCZF_13350 [Gemmataceae bacterium]